MEAKAEEKLKAINHAYECLCRALGTTESRPTINSSPVPEPKATVRPTVRPVEAEPGRPSDSRPIVVATFAIAAVAISVLILMLWFTTPEPAHPAASAASAPTVGPTAPSLVPAAKNVGTAKVSFSFEYYRKAATLRLWVDDEKVLEEKLASPIWEESGGMRRFQRVFDVAAGTHKIRMEVSAGEHIYATEATAIFKAGVPRTLKAWIDPITRGLSFDWY
jgi:hypothetical protein